MTSSKLPVTFNHDYFGFIVRHALTETVRELQPASTEQCRREAVDRLFNDLTCDEFDAIYTDTCGLA